MTAMTEQHDILIVGGGLSGINTAYLFNEALPHRTVTIVEARPVIGGTWTFFKFPGFRTDSYMSLLAFPWYPWRKQDKMVRGHEVASYLEEAARVGGIADRILLEHKVTRCEWSSSTKKWTVYIDARGVHKVYEVNFIMHCSGYYSFSQSMASTIPGIENFKGTIAHPQWWPEELDYTDKKVIILGSGATAVTMLPAMSGKAAKVTMLQRSPSYLANQPVRERLDDFLWLLLPMSLAISLVWWKDMLVEFIMGNMLLQYPNWGRRWFRDAAKKELPADVDVDVHFNPKYNPLEQNLNLVPDNDFFKALHRANCEIVTDVIETMTATGAQLRSGKHIEADIFVTATGLHYQLLAGAPHIVDGVKIIAGEKYAWRSLCLEDVPNSALLIGHGASSWTPEVTVMARHIIKLIKKMEREGHKSFVPRLEHTKDMPRMLATVPLTANYLTLAHDRVPKVSGQGPWYSHNGPVIDTLHMWFGSTTDGLVYS